MNLQAIASGVVAAVNPQVLLSIRVSTGYTTQPDGRRTPSYAPPVGGVTGQLQPMTFRDIQMTEGLNLQGTRFSLYINGSINGLIRVTNQGGDLITTPDGRIWLVAMVLEQWPDWVKVAVVMQTDAS